MKAVLIEKPFELKVVDVPKPQIRNDNEVLVKVLYGGICGSDIGMYNGTNAVATYPRIIGHEFSGVIEETGKGCTRVKPGDHVAVDPVRSCGHCYACRNGRHNVCREVEVIGVHRDGGFAEYVVVPETNVYCVDPLKADPKHHCLVEPYSIGAQVNARGRITKDDKVLIMGSGPIGIGCMQTAKARGAFVIMTDLYDQRLDRAKRMGADITVNVLKDDLEKVIRECTDGEGMPVVIDTVCTPQSLEQAVSYTCPAARVVTLGVKDKPSKITSLSIVKGELDLIGSRLNNYRFEEVIRNFENHQYTPELLYTGVYPMEKAEEAIKEIMEHPESVCKTILSMQ